MSFNPNEPFQEFNPEGDYEEVTTSKSFDPTQEYQEFDPSQEFEEVNVGTEGSNPMALAMKGEKSNIDNPMAQAMQDEGVEVEKPMPLKQLAFGMGEDYENPSNTIPYNAPKKLINRSNELLANGLQGLGRWIDEGSQLLGGSPEGEIKKGLYSLSKWVDKDRFKTEDTHDTESIKEAFRKGGLFDIDTIQQALNFSAEQGIQSVADMAHITASLPQYIVSRGQEMAETRMEEKGLKGQEPTNEDMLIGISGATVSSLLEKVGLKATTSDVLNTLTNELAGKTFKEATKVIGKAVGRGLVVEAGTELIQEGAIEPTTERIGIDTDKPLIDIERGLFGALAGGVTGGTISGTVSTGQVIAEDHATKVRQKKMREYANSFTWTSLTPEQQQLKQELEGMEFTSLTPDMQKKKQQLESMYFSALTPEQMAAAQKEDARLQGIQDNFAKLVEEYQDQGVNFPEEVLNDIDLQERILEEYKTIDQGAESALRGHNFTDTVNEEREAKRKEEEAAEEIAKFFEEEGAKIKSTPSQRAKGAQAEKREQLEKEFGADEDAINKRMKPGGTKKSFEKQQEEKYKGMSEEDLKEIDEQAGKTTLEKDFENIYEPTDKEREANKKVNDALKKTSYSTIEDTIEETINNAENRLKLLKDGLEALEDSVYTGKTLEAHKKKLNKRINETQEHINEAKNGDFDNEVDNTIGLNKSEEYELSKLQEQDAEGEIGIDDQMRMEELEDKQLAAHKAAKKDKSDKVPEREEKKETIFQDKTTIEGMEKQIEKIKSNKIIPSKNWEDVPSLVKSVKSLENNIKKKQGTTTTKKETVEEGIKRREAENDKRYQDAITEKFGKGWEPADNKDIKPSTSERQVTLFVEDMNLKDSKNEYKVFEYGGYYAGVKKQTKKTYTPKYSKHEYKKAYDQLEIEDQKTKGTQGALFGQSQLFDTESETRLKTPKWAKGIVSDTVRYENIVTAITDAKNGEHSELADRAVETLQKDESDFKETMQKNITKKLDDMPKEKTITEKLKDSIQEKKEAPFKTGELDYTNRKLGLSKARSEEKYEDIGIANILLSNLQKGETITLGITDYEVVTITEKTLALKDKNDKKTMYKVDSPKMETLARDIAGEITAGYHGVKTGKELQDIALRDPAINRDKDGILYAEDVRPEKKETLEEKKARFKKRGEEIKAEEQKKKEEEFQRRKDLKKSPQETVSKEAKEAVAKIIDGEIPVVLHGVENDITYTEAYQSRQGISMSPEIRARSIVTEHAKGLAEEYKHLLQYAKTEEKQELLNTEFAKYRDGIVKRRKLMLARDSRVMSTMVTGPANFPTRSNQKKSDSAHKALEDLVGYDEFMTRKIKSKLTDKAAIKSTDVDAIEKLEKKLKSLTDAQEKMKTANKIIRSKSLNDDEKINQLQKELEFSEKDSKELVNPPPEWRAKPGFASYSLTNNNAKIKATEKRIEELKRKKELSKEDQQDIKFEGGYLTQDFTADRIQFIFDGKPDEVTIAMLKKNGFRWSPKNGAWQRQITGNAQFKANVILKQLKETKEDTQSTNKGTQARATQDRAQSIRQPLNPPIMKNTVLPERPQDNKIFISGKSINIPSKVIEPSEIRKYLIELAGERFYSNNLAKWKLGHFSHNGGEIRLQSLNDVETLGHEVWHFIDKAFKTPEIKRFMKDNEASIKQYSYTGKKDLIIDEGMAELLRAYFTNSQFIQANNPKLLQDLDTTLESLGQKKYALIKKIQYSSHFYFNQGYENLNKSAIAELPTAWGNIKKNIYDATNTHMNITRFIDVAHPIRVISKDIGLEEGMNAKNPYIQMRMATGHSESTVEAITRFGTAVFNRDGVLEFTGEGLSEVFKPALEGSKESNNEILDDLYRYFQLVQAEHQIEQGKRTAFNPNAVKKEIAVLSRRTGFQESWGKMMEFNKRQLDFYVSANYITREQANNFSEKNPFYIPTHRVIADNVSGGRGGSTIKSRKEGGSERQLLPVDNIFSQMEKHISSALLENAKSNLFKSLRNNPNGAKWATHIRKGTQRYNALMEQQATHFANMLMSEGMTVNIDNEIVPSDENNEINIGTKSEIFELMKEKLLENPSLATFYKSGQEPTSIDGNIYGVIIDGNTEFFEVNIGTENGKLLNEMLQGIETTFNTNMLLKAAHTIKGGMTRMIVATPDFFLGNLYVDTTSAGVYSKTNFVPGVDSVVGGKSVAAEDQDYQNFVLNGGAFGTRVEMATKENRKRQMMKLSINEKSVSRALNIYDRVLSVGEMATRVGEYKRAIKKDIDPMAAAYMGAEITTDFNMHGSNKAANALRSTVAFLPASINSIYKDWREITASDERYKSVNRAIKKHIGNFGVKGFMYITIPAIISMALSDDDDKERTLAEDARYSHYQFEDFTLKAKTQYLLGMMFEKTPKLAKMAFIEDKGERSWEIAKVGMWSMLVPDATPTILAPSLDIARNKTFTGSPVVPFRLEKYVGDYTYLQFTERTPEIYKGASKILADMGINVSPLHIDHTVSSLMGYVAKWLEDGTQAILWNEEEFGERPDSSAEAFLERHIAHHFKYKDYGQSYYNQKYYEMRREAQSAQSAMQFAANKDGEISETILNDDKTRSLAFFMSKMKVIDKQIKEIRNENLKIRKNKDLTASQKEEMMKENNIKIGKIQKDVVLSKEKQLKEKTASEDYFFQAKDIKRTHKEYNELKKKARYDKKYAEQFFEFKEDKEKMMKVKKKSLVNKVAREIKSIKEKRKGINGSNFTEEKKRILLDRLDQKEKNLYNRATKILKK